MFKEPEKVVGIFKALCLLHRIVGVVAALATEINCRKSIDGHIGAFIDRHKTHHLLLRDVRFENHLASNPVCTLFRDCFLRQLITELYLKLRTVKTAFSGNARNIELELSLGSLLSHKGGGGEDKTQFVNAIKLFFEFLIRIDREAGSSNRHLTAFVNTRLQIVFDGLVNVVYNLHSITSKKFEIHGLPGLIFAQLHFSPWRTHIFSLKPSKIRDGQTKYLLRAILSFRTLPADRSIPAGSWSARWQCGQGRY